jgi:hypothetical protein
MSTGFGSDAKNANITIDLDYVDVILKQYKKIKKYKKSSLYTIKTMDGTETIISSLIKEAEDNPIKLMGKHYLLNLIWMLVCSFE